MAVRDVRDDRGRDERDRDPAADHVRRPQAVPQEEPEEELAEEPRLRQADAARSNAAAGRLHAHPLRPLLRRFRLGRLARPLLEELFVHQPPTFLSSSRRSRSFLFTRFGTWMRTRASTSPLPEALSFGAPRPLIRSNLPSSEPA